jgi:hypothetical protein
VSIFSDILSIEFKSKIDFLENKLKSFVSDRINMKVLEDVSGSFKIRKYKFIKNLRISKIMYTDIEILSKLFNNSFVDLET